MLRARCRNTLIFKGFGNACVGCITILGNYITQTNIQSIFPTDTQGHRAAPALRDTYFMFIDTRWCQAIHWYRQNWIYSFVTVHFNKYKKLYFLHNHFFLYMNSYWGFTKNLQRWLSFFISKYYSHIFPGSKTPFQLKIK